MKEWDSKLKINSPIIVLSLDVGSANGGDKNTYV